MFSGIQSDVWGRKKTMMCSQIVALLGFLCLRFAINISMFYIGSFLGGYNEGVYMVVAAVYTSEINQPKIRNYTLSFNVLAYFFTFALTYLIGSLVS